MNSSNTSLVPVRRALIAAAVVLSTGTIAAFAQTDTSHDTSTNTSSSYGSDMNGSATSTTSSSSMGTNASDTSSSQQSAASSDNTSSAGNSSATSSSSSDKLSWSERRFVRKAAEDGQSEVALGQLAEQNASSPDVRAFAQHLVQDHTKANEQLMQIAQQKDVKIEQKEGKSHEYNKLSKLTGSDFDRQFVDHAVSDHEKDIKEFEKEAKDAKDPEVRQFAAQLLPGLRQHLEMAQQLQKSIQPTGGSSGFSGTSSTSTSSETSSSATNSETSSAGMNAGSSSAGSTGGSSSSSTTSVH